MNRVASTSRRLNHVYWLGGGSGAGKSTLAKRLADQYGMTVYSTDAAIGNHASRYQDESCPLLVAFRRMSMDDRWANRTPETMLETFPWFKGEGFELIVQDLLSMSADEPILVEGFRVLPDLVMPLLCSREQAAWLIPTPAFRLKAFESRGSMWDIANKTSQPKKALENLLKRDALFTDWLSHEVASNGLEAVMVDGSFSEVSLEQRLVEHFKLG